MLGPHTQRDNPLSRIMCAPIGPPVTVCYTTLHYENPDSDDVGGKSLCDTSTSVRGQCVGEFSTGAKSTVILGWTLESCSENFPCHQRMPVSNLYAKTSGRTWKIGGSQI